MPRAKKIRVLLADDHFIVSKGIAAIVDLEDDMKIVGTATNGEEAMQLFIELRPDVLVLDLRMPKIDGVVVVQELMKKYRPCRIVVMTTYGSEEDIKQCLKAGAMGYLLKDSTGDEIVEAIRDAFHGRKTIPAAMAGKLASALAQPELTLRELEVLQLLAAGRSNRDIGDSLKVQESTIKSHVTSILAKLDALSRTEAIAIATQRGLLKPE